MTTSAKRRKSISPPALIALSFLFTIINGTLLLKLPIATQRPISWTDALFTATSATTVTGLSVFDIASTLTVFGKVVLLLLIQVGGVGLMAFAVAVLIILGRKVGMKNRIFIQETFSYQSIGDTVRFVGEILTFVIVIEAIAFITLSIVWVPEFGWKHGLYYSIFHTVSAFNNAGFSLFPDNLTSFAGNPAVTLILSSLFIIGGIGFIVVKDIIQKRSVQHWSLHTKMMVFGTLTVNTVAALFLLILEFHNEKTIGSLHFIEKLWTSYFQAVTPRTAGFNMVAIGDMEEPSLLLTLILMFIGGGSASTASGIKLTTFLVIVLATLAYFRGIKEPHIFRRTIKTEIVFRSMAIGAVSSGVVFVALFLLTITERMPIFPLLFETVSAFGTVGLSLGITGNLSSAGEVILSFVMFLGRIGPLTLFFLLIHNKKESYRYPYDQVQTG
ncbi:Ktr system potassium transporter B [Sporosarcina sp. P37]|uniref:TrkH family potassium uptake protein n=1 Tax=unclassified Sporosarcina TaxID=2647733 RepID=UPI000A179ECF|nr:MULTISPECIES: TrkH family potassium uptake protein [unclassified Sporosarcina]ARK24828.1 Ktr system potassium transporter B [Sporosarcina sp. P37]PID19987.1 Ktr system potassium transporter B [Sporosarcina sp. P35]